MTREFVPHEEALALRELGFNEICLAMYTIGGLQLFSQRAFAIKEGGYNNTDLKKDGVLAAPLYQQAFRWFREEHNLVYSIGHIGHTNSWTFSTENIGLGVANQTWSVHFSTYEEAELECLRELLTKAKKT